MTVVSGRAACLVACILAGITGCEGYSIAYRPTTDPSLRHRSTHAIEVPFTSPGGFVVISIRLGDDPTPRKFVVDTEQSSTLVTPALATRLGRQPRQVRYGLDYYGADLAWVPIVRLPSLWIADVELRGGQAEVVDLDALSQQLCQPIDGVLGIQFPKDLVYEIDYPAGVLRIARSLDHLPIRSGGTAPYLLELVMADGSRAFGADVASTYAGVLEVRTRHHHVIGETRHELAAWPAGRVDEPKNHDPGEPYRLGSHLDARLGAEVLQAYIVRRSYRDTWLYPNDRTLPRGPLSFGFTWTLDGGEATISEVHDSTRALGLIPGATVHAIDDQVLSKLSPEVRCRLHRDWASGRDLVRVTIEPPKLENHAQQQTTATGSTLTVEVPRHSLLTPPRPE